MAELGRIMTRMVTIVVLPDVLTVLALSVTVILVTFYWIRKSKLRQFISLGIPGPNPNFLLGNLWSFRNKTMYQTFVDWNKQYGDTFCYFEGQTPVIVSSDVEFLRQVFMFRFKNFHARKKWPVQVDPDEDENVHMFFARGDRWKRLRAIINPAFSVSKLKMLSPLLNARFNDLEVEMDKLALTGESFDALSLFQRLTLDTISNCGFGLEAEALKNPDDKYLRKCRGILRDTSEWPLLMLLGFMFPSLNKIWIWMYYFIGALNGNPVLWMERSIKQVIQIRKESGLKRQDLMQLLLDAECRSIHEARRNSSDLGISRVLVQPIRHDLSCDVIDLSSSHFQEQLTYIAPTRPMKILSAEEVAAQSFVFLLAGYETTSTALGYVVYELSLHPAIQTRLQAEIREYFPDDKSDYRGGLDPHLHGLRSGVCVADDVTRWQSARSLTYDGVQSLHYLDMVWCETLRKYPLACNVIARECMESCVIEGIAVPKGTVVQANSWVLHHSASVWGPNTTQFDPDRFLPERKQGRHVMSFLPFGAGYRTCIGARFAIMEAKMALVRILRKYTFMPRDGNTPGPLELREGATIGPNGGIHVRITTGT